MPVLLKDATFIDWKTLEFSRVNILAEQGNESLMFVSNTDDIIRDLHPEIIDCAGRIVTRSFVVGHHHVYSALSRGMGAPKKSPADFYEILKYIWWTLDKCLDEKMIESSALVTAIACARAGSTFVIDHHASPFAVRDSLEIIADAFDRVGVSHLLCYEISDRDGADIAAAGLEETASYLKGHQGLVGLHASFTVSDDTLKKAVALMNSSMSGIHIHVAEDQYDQQTCVRDYGMRVVERLAEAGALASGKTILGHCLHLSDKEREIIRNSGCWVVENCESNLNNNVGYFNGAGLGDNIMLGTDGMHSDMLQSTRAAFFSGQRHDNITYPSAYQRLRNGHRYLSENGFRGDGDNNLVVFDYPSPTPLETTNFYGHLLFGLSSANITDVISDGRVIIRDRRATMVDENEILEKSCEQARLLWSRMA